jgi:hypothetical protein
MRPNKTSFGTGFEMRKRWVDLKPEERKSKILIGSLGGVAAVVLAFMLGKTLALSALNLTLIFLTITAITILWIRGYR